MGLEEKLRELRKRHNFSQQEFADMLHVSRQVVSRWETGKTEPNVEMLKQISQIYKITVDDLVKNDTIKNDIVPDEIRYSEYIEYLKSLNLSIMFLAALVTIVIPFVGIFVDIVIMIQLLKMYEKEKRLLYVIMIAFILCITTYYTYWAIF